MTKSTITRQQQRQILIDTAKHIISRERTSPYSENLRELARIALAAMDSEPVAWSNGCNKSVPAALRYLAENPRPIGGESSFNTAHLYQLAREIELMAEAPLYRHAQPDASHLSRICAESYQVVGALAEALRIFNDVGVIKALDNLSAQELIHDDVLPFSVPESAQPAPVVPEEMTPEQAYEIGDYHGDPVDVFERGANWMRQHIINHTLAASPQSPGSEPATVPGKWIPVSERMPEVGDIVLTAMGGVVNVGEMECSAANCRFFTSVISGRELPATHWMPLPAGPQEVKGE